MPEVKSEIKFLRGLQSRWEEFKFTVKVMFEFVKRFRALRFVGPCVTFFGSARFKEDDEYYALTRKAAGEVAKLGFTVMTGGERGLICLNLILVTDSIPEAIQFIRDQSIARYGLVSGPKRKPMKWPFERG